MKDHYSYPNDVFEQQFADSSFPPQLFTHEAHLRLAWIHINKYGVEKAVDNICSQIKTFDQTHGDGSKYHTTVTVAAVRAVNHFMQRSSAASFQDFIEAFPQLLHKLKDLLNSHYSRDIFVDESAKQVYLEPDVQPF